MYRIRLTLLWTVLLILAVPLLCNAQAFGKNKVQYTSFNWSYLQTSHFDIYFYEGEEELAYFVAEYCELAYQDVKEDLRHEIRKRIPIILYKSHNDFQQTNVILELLEEGVGGFTEFFKNRVVMPYTGSYEEFRHVLHHELTHAIMMDLLYGSVVESLVRRQYFFVPPLWVVEGLAEYESLDWDKKSDMFMRDATISGYVQPLLYVGGYMVYKQGQSVIRYIATKYGGEKLGEILSKARLHRNMDKALRSSIGMGIEDLDEEWSKTLRVQYWPEIAGRQEATEFARQLTDHTEDGSNFNLKPAFSPDGNRLAFFSDKSDYTDIYLLSAIDGQVLDRLVKGERSGGLESLHYFKSSLAWSPDGTRIAFVAKSGGGDALYLLRVENRKVLKKYSFPLDLIASPSWSPTGDRIVFSGLKDGTSDLYYVEVQTGVLTRLTEDRYDDTEPVWSPDGDRIAFSSDRSSSEESQADTAFAYGQYDLFVIDVASGQTRPVVVAEGQQRSPSWSPTGEKICYSSDENGIDNLYITDLTSSESFPITDVIGGCFTPSWSRDGKRLAFSYFQKGGWDLYVLKDPLNKRLEVTELEPTPFVLHQKGYTGEAHTTVEESSYSELPDSVTAQADIALADVSPEDIYTDTLDTMAVGSARPSSGAPVEEIDFDYQQMEFQKQAQLVSIEADSTQQAPAETTSIDLGPRKYHVKFTPDLLSGTMGYDTYYGFQGESVLAISDLMGNHRIYLLTSLFYSLSESDFQVAYYYLPRRTDYGIGAFHLKNYFVDDIPRLFSDRLYGAYLSLSRPFNKFNRLDLALQALAIDRYYFDPPYDDSLTRLYQLSGSLVHDTVLWGNTGPVNGSRWNLTAEYAPSLGSSSKSFTRVTFDRRSYIDYRKRYNFVYRVAGGASSGRDQQRYYLGGTSNWLDVQFFRGDQYYTVEDIYFANRITPLRGYDYNEVQGTKFGLVNLEFRYPFVDYLLVNWPLRFGISRVNGALFMDMGSAWDNNRTFKGGTTEGGARLKDLKTGFGFGMRANLGIFVLRFDAAWNTDFAEVSPKPKTYYSLGAEF
ncbi:BamA/TamA family outer membrane protein [Candidatus Zixiibacteriota bacterium]